MIRMVREPGEASPGALAFGLLGGGLAWVVHLFVAYAVGEWGCVSGFARHDVLGITVVVWLVLGVTLLTGAVAAAAALVAYRSERRLRRRESEREKKAGERGSGIDTAQTGLYLSGLFLFVILVETIPVFYWLEGCGR